MFDKLRDKLRFKEVFKQGEVIKILLDQETGVNYLLCHWGGLHETSITPLLGPDGKPVITKD